ncbi:hypothetical protein [Clostridium perfringens]|jgi:hypothetical protein|uniref:CdiI immunity protein domain-containing protein n=1 Tax=Clostridium perfringens TaxID=1502 RepID=A0AAW4IZV9_CLOPF|nr:hypothetical protein [Clostridium perfringens]MBO3356114.1 hypothetical protein [Clostridium perfringens]MBO3359545.1 hypothetical protein [Clostridium perfringens]
MKILKNKYLKNIEERLENINLGSYYEEDWEYAEDYFDEASNIDELIESINNIIPTHDVTKEEIDTIQSEIDNLTIELEEPTNYPNFTFFYEDAEKLGDVIYTKLDEKYIEK